MTKRALIVDDSKTARQVLSGKLSNYGIAVDALESAAAAIDYLYENAPDAIFMDYEMPGMDGFQALKVIKSNPHTALIPVMMYTSKEGGLALSQARALGAVGVLPKQLEAQDLEGVLNSLHLMPEQESLVHGFKDDVLDGVSTLRRRGNIHPINEHDRRKTTPAEPVSLPMDNFQDSATGVESLRRFIHREQGQSEERLQLTLEKQFAELQGELFELEAVQEESGKHARRGQLLGILSILFLFAGFMLIYYFLMFSPLAQQSGNFSQNELSEEAVGLINAQSEKIELLTEAFNVGGFGRQADNISVVPVKLIEWAANQGAEFDYGERPFNDQRALWLSELVDQLKDAGFRGTIELRATHGNFCLEKSGAGELSIANEGLDVNECLFAAELRGNNEWLNDQSVAFANYLNVELARSGGELEILLFSSGFNDPLITYPALYNVKSVNEWNRIAAQNQRVRVSLYTNQE